MKRVAVIGAGVAGLSVARLLSGTCSVVVFEAESRPGGLISCDVLREGLFHRCGGHVFNTKDESVASWFWSLFDREREFIKAKRNSAVYFERHGYIPYPVENHVYQMGPDVYSSFRQDLLQERCCGQGAQNFKEFLLERFGKTLYNLYFGPYNSKIWGRDLSDVPLAWLEGKLPMPTTSEMLQANEEHLEERTFVHSSFWYPRSGGSQFIADRLADGLDIRFKSPVSEICLVAGKVLVNGERFDHVVYCGNVMQLPRLLMDPSMDRFAEALKRLESHGTTTVFCTMDDNPYSWIYQPSSLHGSHRIICTGNLSQCNTASGFRRTCTVEFSRQLEKTEIVEQLKLMPLHLEYVTHHFSRYTYPIQTKNTRQLIGELKTALWPKGVSLVGRFSEWEYFNMDAVMASAMRQVDSLVSNF